MILLSVEFHTASCDTFYIVPTPSSHCPGEFTGVPCLTLQQYASNPSQSQNITFRVEPGTYNLSTILTVSNGYNFTMSSTNATVVCTSSTAQFMFNTVENVHISGMTFQSCKSSFDGVENVHISGTTFQRCRSSYGAIQMSRVAMAYIMNSHFIENGVYTSSSAYRGGALYVTYSTVSISDCRFQNNQARSGGAIYVVSSQITISNRSTFNYSRAYYYGGAIYSSQSTFTVDSTTFSQNSAQRYDGGAIYMDNYNSIGHIRATNTMFSENSARSGGAIYITYRTCSYSWCHIHT